VTADQQPTAPGPALEVPAWLATYVGQLVLERELLRVRVDELERLQQGSG
jgi:hypothetical protein